jgi:hypothetical protein
VVTSHTPAQVSKVGTWPSQLAAHHQPGTRPGCQVCASQHAGQHQLTYHLQKLLHTCVPVDLTFNLTTPQASAADGNLYACQPGQQLLLQTTCNVS